MTTSSTEPTASEQALPEVAQPESAQPAAAQPAAAQPAATQPEMAQPEAEHEPIVTETKQNVEIVRSVRYGRILVVFAVLGGLLAALACVFFPVNPEQHYTLAQIMGFMAMIGAAAGLCVGGIISILLNLAAKRRKGTAVAIQSDVQ
ncbi:hypothetical protein ICM05_02395 [Leucobacter sp. cx-42]|uniref:hypothetical protein n=1 Tax=unclassified Leucobacter TaxID=2621730 RepID=UPI00165E1F40|nr:MULTISPECIES: hypothetical protein [unclassified Leucobacter]MBC9953500.1 hypothetical protein [Leucobacter sp. cx-42]